MTAPAQDPDPREMTVKEFAAYNRVTVRTVYEWVSKGAVEVRYTPGGGIRILERRRTPRELKSADVR